MLITRNFDNILSFIGVGYYIQIRCIILTKANNRRINVETEGSVVEKKCVVKEDEIQKIKIVGVYISWSNMFEIGIASCRERVSSPV